MTGIKFDLQTKPRPPRETAVVKGLQKTLRAMGAKVLKVHGSIYTEGEPDLIASLCGHTIVIECKQRGKKPTPLQNRRLLEWAESGATVLVANDAGAAVNSILDTIPPHIISKLKEQGVIMVEYNEKGERRIEKLF